MENVTLNSIKIENGEEIAYRERLGGHETVLLIHGNMTSSKHWDLLMNTMDNKYKIYAVDMRGFGASSYHTPINSIKDFSEDIKQFVEAIGLKKFSLIGWSTGGAVSMQFAIDYPDLVESLVLLASASTRGYPFFQFNSQGEKIRVKTKEEIMQDPLKTMPVLNAYKFRDKDFLMKLWNGLIYTNKQPSDNLYDEYLEDMMTQRNLVDVYHALNIFNISDHNNGITEGSGKAKHISVPTLVLWGENDLVITEKMINEIVQDIGLNDEDVVYLQGCGHSPLVDNIDLLNREISRFFNKVNSN